MLRRYILLLLPFLFLLMAARQAPLINPDPIAVPSKVKQEQVARAIKTALVKRTWTVTGEKPGQIQASLSVRDHIARIRIDYDKTIRITYVNSQNLAFEEKKGQTYIHKNYLGWINNLVSDINGNLILLSD